MEEIYESLLSLQSLDNEIALAAERVDSFTPKLAQVDEPATILARDLEEARKTLNDLRESIRRLEKGASEKRGILERYEERLQRVRNSREDAAVKTEIDLIRRAAEADENDALELMEQAVRAELQADELEAKYAAAREAVEPQRRELEAARAAAADELAILRDRRENQAIRIKESALRLYERIRGNNGRAAIARITADGACGVCYGIIPIQRQTEVRQGPELVRCEECGVILCPAD